MHRLATKRTEKKREKRVEENANASF